MEWNKDAISRLEKVPIFVRKIARSKIEKYAREKGKDIVTVEDVDGAKASFSRGGGNDDKVPKAAPLNTDTAPDDDKFEILKKSGEYEEENGYPAMYQIDTCRGESVDCPFLILSISSITQKIRDRLREIDFSRKLIDKIEGKILPHQRLKVAISSCPNCCSQPQIRDFGLHVRAKVYVDKDFDCNGCGNCLRACKEGAIKIKGLTNKSREEDLAGVPSENNKLDVTIDYDRCVHCGLCAEVCPTGTIKTDRKCYRIMIGGKLGRHPRFADDLIDFADETEVLNALDVCVDAILNEKKEKRFGDMVQRIGIDEFKRRVAEKGKTKLSN